MSVGVRRPPTNAAIGLVRTCHPIPTVGVTVFAAALGWAAGNGVTTCVLLALAVLCGQVTIGWSNDLLDRDADALVGRQDKPVALGVVSPRTLAWAITVAAIACVGFSFSLGWRAGLVHLFAVGCGWAYNLWLKGTWASAVPYAVAFGALPCVATLALPVARWPGAWVVGAGALLGIAANLTNAVPDLERDSVAGFRGLASRLGAYPSVVISAVLLVAAAACIAFGPAGPPSVAGWTGFALSAVIAAVAVPALRRTAGSRVPFYGLMALVPIDIAMILIDNHHLR